MRPRRPVPPDRPAALGTLGDLLARRGLRQAAAEPGPTAPDERPPPPAADLPDLARCGRLVVRRERTGHGGKTATVVSGLAPGAADLEGIARAVRRALGCGASIDGKERLIVHGEQMERVTAWLTRHGARRVVRGT